MNKKNLAGALIASLSLPLMLATFSVPLANAAGVSSSVATVDNCKWVMANIPGAISMASGNNAKFNGDALSVSAALSGPTLGLSGSTSTVATSAASSTECSFYNRVLNASLSATLDTVAFVASYVNEDGTTTSDAAMDFSLAAGVPLVITPDITACTVPELWTSTIISFTSATSEELIAFTSETDEYAAGAAPRCAPPGTIEVQIPQRNTVPVGAGSQYSFTGPTITFSSTPSNSYNYVAGTE
jgi:hypothetical protein